VIAFVRASGYICRRRKPDAFNQLILINMMGHITQVLRGDACARGARIAARGRASRQHGMTRGCPEETGPAYYVADHVHTLAAGYSVMGQNCKIGMITEERSSASKALNNTDVFVYPNPTTGNDVQIEAGFPIASIRLVNSLGQQVSFRRFSELSTQVNAEFNAPNGIYLLEVTGGNQLTAQTTILIQH
jgi:Secretion system C-terminal sorting domain